MEYECTLTQICVIMNVKRNYAILLLTYFCTLILNLTRIFGITEHINWSEPNHHIPNLQMFKIIMGHSTT